MLASSMSHTRASGLDASAQCWLLAYSVPGSAGEQQWPLAHTHCHQHQASGTCIAESDIVLSIAATSDFKLFWDKSFVLWIPRLRPIKVLPGRA